MSGPEIFDFHAIFLMLKKSFLFSLMTKLVGGSEISIFARDALILLTRLDFFGIYYVPEMAKINNLSLNKG